MFSVSRAKGETGLDRCGSDQRIGYLNAVSDRMLLDEGGGRGPDGFGKGQNSELKLAERLLDLMHLQFRAGALKKLHEGDNGQGAIRCAIYGAGCAFVAAGRPDQNVGIEDHFGFRTRSRFFVPGCAAARGRRKRRR